MDARFVQSCQEMTTEFFVEYASDGTFTARLDKGRTVTAAEEDLTCEVKPDGYLEIRDYRPEKSVLYRFAKLDTEQLAALDQDIKTGRKAVVGSWVSRTSIQDFAHLSQSEVCEAYNVTFSDDGRLEGCIIGFGPQDGTELSTNWHLAEIYRAENGLVYRYDFEVE